MSRSSLIVGLVVAAALHAILFLPGRMRSFTQPRTKPPDKHVKVLLPSPPPPGPARKAASVRAVPQGASPARQMARVHEPATPHADVPTPGNTASEHADGADLPVLRILWRSHRQLRDVAIALGMSIVAVDREGRIIGQVASSGPVAIAPFTGSLASHSNRVRTLPRGFFGPSLDASGAGVDAFWILVPADVDRAVVAAQRAAIAEKGLTPRQVRSMDGRFQQAGGTYRFVVTGVTER